MYVCISLYIYVYYNVSIHPSIHLSPHAPATQFADCGQASVAVPAHCGKGVGTEPCNLVPPDGQWHVRTMPKPAAATAAATTKGATAAATTKGATKGATTKGATAAATTKGATKVSKPSSTSVESVDEVIGGGGDKRRASAEAESGPKPKKQLTISAAFKFSKDQVSERGPY
jgi:hypothetical protein